MSHRVSVRALCEFTAKAGDLDHRFTPSPSAREGIAGHQTVAARRGAGYESELPLDGDYLSRDGPTLRVGGRVDGYDSGANRLEEVKTYRGDLARMGANQRALHWAQVRVYGTLLCRSRGLEQLTLALVYLDIATRRETVLTEHATRAELEAFFEAQCRGYLAWAEQEGAHRDARDAALRSLRFPHQAFRRGQRELAEAVYKAASTGRCLLAEATTGIGKTLGTLFPMLAAMPRQGLDRLFFLTAKTTGRGLALEALGALDAVEDAPLPLRVLELVARDKACEHPDKACHGEACPLARGFYDRLPAARQAAVARGGRLDQAALRELALAHDVCPYFLGQELARWCDVIVGDVNHYFDASAMLYALTQAHRWRVGVLVDEAHNLVERGRGMYSAELDQRRFNALRRAAPPALSRPLARVARRWNALVKAAECPEASGGSRDASRASSQDYRVLEAPPSAWLEALQLAAGAITDRLAEHPGDADPELQRFLFEALEIGRLAEAFGDHSLFDITRHGVGRDRRRGSGRPTTVCLRNLVPASFLAPRFAASRTTALFSATLSPARYYRDLLGLPEDTPWLEVASPFAAAQLEVRIRRDISTRLAHREASLAPIVATLAEHFHRAPGNYLAFFSSFAYLEAAAERFAACHPEIPHWRQGRGMGEPERRDFLARFTPEGRGIGFAVLGGAFAEGIDLPGERLIGAFIATLGLPPFDPVNERLRARLEEAFGQGYAYAYLYPGLKKVVQAAGRVIRRPEDRGLVVLMDERFARPEVEALLPSWWRIAP